MIDADGSVRALARFSTPDILGGLKVLGLPHMALATLERDAVRSVSPSLGSCAGTVVTRRVATRRYGPAPDNDARRASEQRMRDLVAAVRGPSLLVIQNMGDWRGPGCAVGAVIASIYSALGCVGAITNGAVRDMAQMEACGFHAFAGGIGTGGGYIDCIDEGEPVALGGLVIRTGDVLHADPHGIVMIPPQYVAGLPDAIAQTHRAEARAVAEGDYLGLSLVQARMPTS